MSSRADRAKQFLQKVQPTGGLEGVAEATDVESIAERAALSQGTVRNYLSSAVSKLGVENRHAAVRLARERGWV